ncbi:c(7)-type cytochrome triheme domain-containing protein [Nitrospirota bacterium]
MKKIVILVVVILAIALVGTAIAMPKGKVVDFETKMGKVTFSIDDHLNAGNKCNDCHTKIFPMKSGVVKNPAPHKDGDACFVCHGKSGKSPKKCGECHKK